MPGIVAGQVIATLHNDLAEAGDRSTDQLNPVEIHNLAAERRRAGAALRRAQRIVGLSDKEACALLGLTPDRPMDKAQWSRWCSGEENIVLARVYGTKLHGPFAIEQARDARPGECIVETTVIYRAVLS